MGMFDSFKVAADNVVNIPLPKDEYQSKDLDCLLLNYFITKEGKLELGPVGADGEEVSPIWAASHERHISEPSNKAHDIGTGRFSGELEIYGDDKETGKWEEYRLLVENNEILFVLHYGEIIYTSDPESNDDFMRVLYPPAEQLVINPSTLVDQRMLSTKHLSSIPQQNADVDAMIRELGIGGGMEITGISRVATGEFVEYKRPTIEVPENHMVLFTHIDENKKDILHFVTHYNVNSYNDLLMIVTDQEGNELERHDTLWKLQTARGEKAIDEGRQNTFDDFINYILEEYGSTVFLYPTLSRPLFNTFQKGDK